MSDDTLAPAAGHEGDMSVNVCKLTEEGKYAFAGLAANILAEQFDRAEEK